MGGGRKKEERVLHLHKATTQKSCRKLRLNYTFLPRMTPFWFVSVTHDQGRTLIWFDHLFSTLPYPAFSSLNLHSPQRLCLSVTFPDRRAAQRWREGARGLVRTWGFRKRRTGRVPGVGVNCEQEARSRGERRKIE